LLRFQLVVEGPKSMRCISTTKVALKRTHFKPFSALPLSAQDVEWLTLAIFQTREPATPSSGTRNDSDTVTTFIDKFRWSSGGP
jgi:hypothetical protein